MIYLFCNSRCFVQLREDGPCFCSPLRLLCIHFAVTLAQILRTAYFKHSVTFRPYMHPLVSQPVLKLGPGWRGKCHRNVRQKKSLVLPQLLIRLLKCCWCAQLCIKHGDQVCLLNEAA